MGKVARGTKVPKSPKVKSPKKPKKIKDPSSTTPTTPQATSTTTTGVKPPTKSVHAKWPALFKKHLGLLEEAGLVTTRRQGRSKLHYLNPVPIGLVADRWISKYAAPFTQAMVGLKKGLESP